MPNVLRTNRDLRILFIAQNLSYIGDWFTFVALAGLVQDVTDSALLVSLLLVAFSLPSFLASPIGGPVADRYDRRTVLVIVSSGLHSSPKVSSLHLPHSCVRRWKRRCPTLPDHPRNCAARMHCLAPAGV